MPENNQLSQFIQKSDIATLPVLPNTMQVLKEALEKPSFNYRSLDKILQYDPACMINLLSYANLEINKDFDKQISQVEHAAMFLGMDKLEKFISRITSVYSIKDKKVADKIIRLQHRGVHAAFQAQNFARMVNSSALEEIYTSALITPLSELICWHIEPIKAQKVELLIHKKSMDYEHAQREVFGFSYHELAESLTHQWHIPNLFLQRQEMEQLDDAPKAVLCIYLAEKCSIITEKGWYYDAMYEHQSLCSNKLRYSEGRIAQELHKTTVEMAHNCSEFFPIQSVSSYLALLPGEVPYTQIIDIAPKKKASVLPIQKPKQTEAKPEQVLAARSAIKSFNLINTANDFPGLIRITMDALYETKAFNRIAFMMLDKAKKKLQVRSLRGHNSNKFTETVLPVQPTNLFTKLLEKPQSVFVNQQNHAKFAPIINQSMQNMLDVQEFIAKSVHVNGKPIGLFYMDKHPLKDNDTSNDMDVEDFNLMKKICTAFEKQLAIIS